MTLYELTNDWLQLQAMLEDPEMDQQAIEDTLESLDFEIEDKAENYAKLIRNMEGGIEAIKHEEERLALKRRNLTNSIDRLKQNLMDSMNATGKRKIKTDLFQISIQKNGGADPVIVDVPTDNLPIELVIIKEEPDKKAIAALLKAFPEAGKKYAHFGERGESLRIK